MNADVYVYVLIASIGGGVAGALVMWNRRRAETSGPSWWRSLAVLLVGLGASACGLIACRKAFGPHSLAYAALVVVLVTGAVAVAQSVTTLPVPRLILRVRDGEFRWLRRPWLGVTLFGRFLASTPLRHLGGRVYLAGARRDLRTVLQGAHDAERVHLWALAATFPWLIAWGARGHWHLIALACAVHLPLNLLPVLHLRYTCWRLERHLARSHCGRTAGTRPGRPH